MSDSHQTAVTRLLQDAAAGRWAAADQLLPLVYEQLRAIAQQRMDHERPDHTLSATALVHEAYLKLVGDADVRWEGRRHFFAAAAEAMRRILIDRARQRRRLRHGGRMQRLELTDALAAGEEQADDRLVAVDAALEELARHDPDKAELVKLRYYAGLTVEQAAQTLGMSRATADRHWAYARAWLFDRIQRENPGQ